MFKQQSRCVQISGRRGFSSKTIILTVLALSLVVLISTQLQIVTSPTAFWDTINLSSRPQQRSLNVRLHPEEHIARNATTQRLHWHIASALRSPDGVQKQVYLINGVFPGPVIEARPGDRLIIHVENGLEEGTAIHWHGLDMKGANDMDGAIGITQLPILPGQTFTYDFRVSEKQHGTFWYHAHDQVQRADGLYGGIVVHEPREEEQADTTENLLMIGDWYHRSANDVLTWYLRSASFGNEPVPDSLVVNGMGVYNCSNAVPARPVDCSSVPQPLLDLDLAKHNILRVVNTGSFAGIALRFHGLDIVGAQQTVIWPGQRLDVQVAASHEPRTKDPKLEIELSNENFKYSNPALTSIQQFPIATIGTAGSALAPEPARPETSKPKFPDTADMTMMLYSATQILSHLDNVPHGFLNHTSWKPASTALIASKRTDWDADQLVPLIPYNALQPLWVDVVLNNLDEDSHPFHLHGYSFYVLASHTSSYGWGSYNPYQGKEPPGGPLNLEDPPLMDTVYVPRRGYVVLRFLADNPGIWMFHCHILWHQASGMAMAFQVGG